MFEDKLRDTLKNLEDSGLRRRVRLTASPQGPTIKFDGREVHNFCSNNYLGLANDSRLGQSIVESIRQEGYGASASRLICGSMPSHHNLEERMASFKGTEACLLYNTGYMANVGILSSLFDKDDMIFCDKLNHASIIDGIRLCQVPFKRYRHADMDHLEQLLAAAPAVGNKCVVTDSIFSMDGDVAPLDKIVEIAKRHHAVVMVDEAHAFGVMGQTGKGCVEHFGLTGAVDIQMGTFSKAAGSFGAYCCGSRALIDVLINKSRSFIYTTGLPPLIAAASLKAVDIIEQDQSLRQQLWDNTHYTRAALRLAGFNTMNSSTPIIPILIGDNHLAIKFSQQLFEEGILVLAVRPPTVPPNTARLRLTLTAKHNKADIDYVLNKFVKIGKELKVI
ncbi:MAG: 8-amino-7-oxononanoate synthase [Candidatus Omnitrophica bacterium]|nr:8-amino-7-oxononanoate synthase [Candidatus Omnitrophota bacterium]